MTYNKDAVKTLLGGHMEVVRTLCARGEGQKYCYAYFVAIPQRAGRFSERRATTVASPFAVTGPLGTLLPNNYATRT